MHWTYCDHNKYPFFDTCHDRRGFNIIGHWTEATKKKKKKKTNAPFIPTLTFFKGIFLKKLYYFITFDSNLKMSGKIIF